MNRPHPHWQREWGWFITYPMLSKIQLMLLIFMCVTHA